MEVGKGVDKGVEMDGQDGDGHHQIIVIEIIHCHHCHHCRHCRHFHSPFSSP